VAAEYCTCSRRVFCLFLFFWLRVGGEGGGCLCLFLRWCSDSTKLGFHSVKFFSLFFLLCMFRSGCTVLLCCLCTVCV
jgi:hypothetical protein